MSNFRAENICFHKILKFTKSHKDIGNRNEIWNSRKLQIFQIIRWDHGKNKISKLTFWNQKKKSNWTFLFLLSHLSSHFDWEDDQLEKKEFNLIWIWNLIITSIIISGYVIYFYSISFEMNDYDMFFLSLNVLYKIIFFLNFSPTHPILYGCFINQHSLLHLRFCCTSCDLKNFGTGGNLLSADIKAFPSGQEMQSDSEKSREVIGHKSSLMLHVALEKLIMVSRKHFDRRVIINLQCVLSPCILDVKNHNVIVLWRALKMSWVFMLSCLFASFQLRFAVQLLKIIQIISRPVTWICFSLVILKGIFSPLTHTPK